ncbi:hypothetical protein D3218_15420 [Aureimonas flava]|uniref:Uncharacterized protein n=1 Tax=Aureimonas flava TaxID=2320271 RepID=A0A3A1WJV5_9HYPH|nr:hypothetical protein [Aureimonas flava]RIX99160.1 hypothetical protein D3218_15420 [Aureimonas flava]
MSEDEFAELVRDCPVLYHMTTEGSWLSIRRHGLWGTAALLDLFEVEGEARRLVEARRAASVRIRHPEHGGATIRDQKPLAERSLAACLEDGLRPADWYALLNARAFFSLTRARLLRLLNAGSYRAEAHDVIEADTASLVAAHRDRITLCAINSGFAARRAAPRGRSTFLPIADYPYAAWRAKRARGERVVELAVEPGVPDIAAHVRRVVRMRGGREIETLWRRG